MLERATEHSYQQDGHERLDSPMGVPIDFQLKGINPSDLAFRQQLIQFT